MRKLLPITEEFWSQEVHSFNQKITEEFIQQSHFSPRSAEQYKSMLRQFFKWVYDNCENKPLTELKARHGLMYQNYLTDRDLAANSIRTRRATVSSLCGFIEVYYAEEYPTFRSIFNKSMPSIPKSLRHTKDPLSREDIINLTVELGKLEKYEMLAYIWFTYTTGCRKSEVAQLKREVIHYSKVPEKNYYLSHTLRAKGKGRKGLERKVAFDDMTMSYLRTWMREREDDDSEYLFLGASQKRRAGRFNHMCRRFTKMLGRRVYPHLFRGTRATHLIEEGKSIEAVRALLGHTSIETTKQYIYSDKDELDDIF